MTYLVLSRGKSAFFQNTQHAEQQNLFAFVVLAHYAILLDRPCSRAWWIRKLPSQLVATALSVLGSENRSWIEWPISVVGLAMPED